MVLDTFDMLKLISHNIQIVEDPEFGYAVELRREIGKPIIKGKGTTPKAAFEDFVNKFEKG